jgi:polyisoprenoid-binding protein YceI
MRNRPLLALTGVLALAAISAVAAQAPGPAKPAPAGQSAPAAVDTSRPQRLELVSGTKARYKVREQLAGVSFPSDAVGTTEAVTGVIIVAADGSISSDSKVVVDLTTITSDQSLRDGYVRSRVFEVEKYPTLVFVPKRAVGLPAPLPEGMQAQAGFQLVGDMTLHGVTREITWNVVATFWKDTVAGRATTTMDFPTFNLAKPSLARLLSVDDKIELEIEFRAERRPL